jgi:hypothetical protein
LDFAHSGSSSHCNVFLATLRTMCHLSLGVWTNILSVFLLVLFCFCMYIFVFAMYIKFFLFVCYYVVNLVMTYIVTVDCMSLVCLTCLNIAYH